MNAVESGAPIAAYEWREGMPLENTLRLPARSSRALILNRLDAETLERREVAEWLADPATRVLGGGSNVVFVQPDLARSVHIGASRWWVESQPDGHVDLVAEAGLALDRLVRETAARHWFGLEALAEIPGTVGAAPMQNVGAYGTELAECVRWVEAWDRREGGMRRFAHAECDFGYRRSRFKAEAGRWLILRVGLRLTTTVPSDWPPAHYPGLEEALGEWQQATGKSTASMSPREYAAMITRMRLGKLPDWRAGLPGSAGSFFHNPIVSSAQARALAAQWPRMPQFAVEAGVKIPAGWLIEQADLRGFRHGPVGVSPRHALVLLHYGQATGAAFLRFAEFVRERVRERFGIELVIEPECLRG